VRLNWIMTLCALGLCILALPSGAQADTIKFVGASGPVIDGVYVAPYQLSINGGPSINAMCDDFKDEVTGGETWNGAVAAFPLNGNFTGGLFGSNAKLYDEAVWLYGQYLGGGNAGGINFAIWSLFDNAITQSGQNGNSGYVSTGAAAWVASANTWYASGGANTFNFGGYDIITPTGWDCNSDVNNCQNNSNDRPQEYITYTAPTGTPTTTPEPASLLLFGTGLIGIAALIRKRQRR
jgi:hypothetical protein